MAVLGLSVLAPAVAQGDLLYRYYAVNYYAYAGAGGFGLGPAPPPPGPGPGGGGCGGVGCLGSNIGRRGFVVAEGRRVVVSGPVRCGRGQDVNLRITVSQRRRTALAQVGLRGPCPVGLRRYQFTLPARLGTFTPGRAFACLLGATERGGRYLDVNQWCHPITLVAGPAPGQRR
jgi:hypothetical protein